MKMVPVKWKRSKNEVRQCVSARSEIKTTRVVVQPGDLQKNLASLLLRDR